MALGEPGGLSESQNSPCAFDFKYYQVLDSEFNLFPSTDGGLPSGAKLSLMVFLHLV